MSFFRFHGSAVQNQFFQLVMGFHQNRSARSLVDAAGFHSNHTVFYDIYDADTVFSAQLVQLGDDFRDFIALPFRVFGTPASKVMVTYSASSGAFSGETPRTSR